MKAKKKRIIIDFHELPESAKTWFLEYFMRYPNCEGNEEMNKLREQVSDCRYREDLRTMSRSTEEEL